MFSAREFFILPDRLERPKLRLLHSVRNDGFCVRDGKGLVQSTGAKRTPEQPDPTKEGHALIRE